MQLLIHMPFQKQSCFRFYKKQLAGPKIEKHKQHHVVDMFFYLYVVDMVGLTFVDFLFDFDVLVQDPYKVVQ